MPINALVPYQEKVDALVRQQQEASARFADLEGQLHRAEVREADLQQQLNAKKAEAAKLGFMQLTKKMALRTEQDSITRKLNDTQQRRKDLRSQYSTARETLEALEQELTEARLALAQAELAQAQLQLAQSGDEAPARVEKPVIKPVEAPRRPAPEKRPPDAPKARRPQQAPVRRSAARAAEEAALPLPEQISNLMTALEPYYPEHQLFAPDVLPAELRSRLMALVERSGCATPAEFLQQQGWQLITPAQARSLRRSTACPAGEEPAVIRPKLDSVLRRLERHYPDRMIHRSIQHDHKGLAQDTSALSQWLGYDSVGAMLTAYGFRYEVPTGGRPATNAAAALQALREAYADAARPHTISQIMSEHPEYAGMLKTLQNQAPTRFGMSLRQYLTQEGILAPRG